MQNINRFWKRKACTMALEMTKESILARKFYAAALADFDRLIEAAAEGDDDAKLELAVKMEGSVSARLYFEPVFGQSLEIYEELGKKGNVKAMERAASLYAEGSTNCRIMFKEQPSGTNTVTTVCSPDLTQAYNWCARARDAGSKWAAENLPRIEKAIVDDVMRTPRP
jgi:hypothetical protein